MVYTVSGDTHRMMVRTADGAVATAISNAFHGILNRMAPDLYGVNPLNLEYAVKNSNVRNTAPWSNLSVYGAGTAISQDDRVKSISFVGRSFLGHKTKLFLFGYKVDANGDYRTTSAENANVASVVTYLNAAVGFALSIDGAQPVW
jgi:hypothetical protein